MKCIFSTSLILAALAWHIVIFRLSPKLGLVKENFKKKPVMASYGIVAFGYVAAIVGALGVLGYAQWAGARLYLAVMGAMWALGVLDDLFGNRKVGGFRGHFRKLLSERKVTTGVVKAAGGALVGLVAGWVTYGNNVWLWLGTAVLIPLAANTLNLLDLRPGRATAVFFVGTAVTCLAAYGSLVAPWVVGTTAAVAFAFGIADSRGKAMMGDSGANALGAALGLTIALDARVLMGPAIVLFAVVQLYSEKRSISALIERSPVLRSIDQRLGVR